MLLSKTLRNIKVVFGCRGKSFITVPHPYPKTLIARSASSGDDFWINPLSGTAIAGSQLEAPFPDLEASSKVVSLGDFCSKNVLVLNGNVNI